jgi:hypothetical protein
MTQYVAVIKELLAFFQNVIQELPVCHLSLSFLEQKKTLVGGGGKFAPRSVLFFLLLPLSQVFPIWYLYDELFKGFTNLSLPCMRVYEPFLPFRYLPLTISHFSPTKVNFI